MFHRQHAFVCFAATSLLALASVRAHAQAEAQANPQDDWSSAGGYVGGSGGFAFQGFTARSSKNDSDWNSKTLRDDKNPSNDKFYDHNEVGVKSGWQGTGEAGFVLPCGDLQWMRFRLGGEVGGGRYDLKTHNITANGDVVSGNLNFLRLGPAAAVDFRIPNSRFSFSAGVGGGIGRLNVDATATNGAVSAATDRRTTNGYASGLVAANYALTHDLDLCLSLRNMWVMDARFNGSSAATDQKKTLSIGTVELGLRFKF